MSINELFNTNANTDAAANARSLAGTAQLTQISMTIANQIIKFVESNFEQYQELIAKSKSDHNAMDNLISATGNLSDVDIEFLKELDETTLDNMLKSQQSKRSRSKGKVMTMDNYKAMMIGAIAENLIRLATGKSKGSTGMNRANGSVEYTAEQLTELSNDQEKLRKEIRNVQSKKSIMKSKEDFSEEDERWQALLRAEEQLKGLRTEVKTVVIDDTKNKLAELLSGKDVSTLTDEERIDLLKQAMSLVTAPVETAEEIVPQVEETTDAPQIEAAVEAEDAGEIKTVVEIPSDTTPPAEDPDFTKDDDDALNLVNNKRNRKNH